MQSIRAIVLIVAAANLATARSIEIASSAAYIHGNGTLVAQFDSTSSGYFSTLDGDNVGAFGWTYTNLTGFTFSNFAMLGFLDADLDRAANTFFNEYGVFVDLSLPPSAPGGSVAASSWQIDEPGFVFGTIIADLAARSLRNQNFVPSNAPDDVSLALGFDFGSLSPGQTATLTLRISTMNIGGLQQVDPESGTTLYLNGYATVESLDQPPSPGVPEPTTLALSGMGLALLVVFRTTSHHSSQSK